MSRVAPHDHGPSGPRRIRPAALAEILLRAFVPVNVPGLPRFGAGPFGLDWLTTSCGAWRRARPDDACPTLCLVLTDGRHFDNLRQT